MSLLAHTIKTATGGSGITSDAIDTTGATLLVAIVAGQTIESGTVTDSKGNTWTQLTVPDSSGTRLRLSYCLSPTVGTGHTFSTTSTFATLAVAAFDGGTYQVWTSTGKTNSGTSLALALIGTEPLIVSGLATTATGTLAVTDLTITDQAGFSSGQHFGGALAYGSVSAAVTPTWSWTGASEGVTTAMPFYLPSAGGGGGGETAHVFIG